MAVVVAVVVVAIVVVVALVLVVVVAVLVIVIAVVLMTSLFGCLVMVASSICHFCCTSFLSSPLFGILAMHL